VPCAKKIVLALSALACAFAVGASTAQASPYGRMLRAYGNTGSIPACRFSSAQLGAALRSIGDYQAQYFADFSDAIRRALLDRGAGACTKSRAAVIQPTGPASVPNPSLTASTSSDLPAPLAMLAAISAALTLLGALGWVAWLRGWDPAWAAEVRHAVDEAEHRMGGAFSDLADWLRVRG
jgi:hypothetical protein